MTDPTPDPASPIEGTSPVPPPAPPLPAAPQLSPTPPSDGGWGGGKVSRGLVVVLAPVLALVMFASGVFVARSAAPVGTVVASASPTAAGSLGPDGDLALIDEAWHALQDNYVDAAKLDNRALAYAAIRGVTDAVGDDGHTSFLTADEAKAVDQSLSGTFVGIGVQVDVNDQKVPYITSVFPNTPAAEAGLKRGDRILVVDGKPTSGETIDQTVARVRGPEGETVALTMGRDGAADFEVTIKRRKFDLPLISWAMVPGRTVAMIRLDQFATGATKALEGAIKDARAAGATAIVFDLRGNPGGYVNEAVGVASQFVGEGIVYQSFDRSGKQQDAAVEPGGLATDIPMIVLANGDTASSAEIVTGAIQDAKRGQVVGEKTFGTGTVLGRFDLADGSQLRIGIERWLTRNGRPIWHEGLEPDVKVVMATTVTPVVPNALREMSASELAASADTQLQKALELLVGKG